MESEKQPPRPRAMSWPRAATTIAVVAILVGAGVFVLKSVLDVPRQAFEGGREALEDLRKIAQAFNSGTITTTFISYATEVNGSNYLQFATLRQWEVFERTDSRSTLWGHIELPDVVVQATAPVEYTYYLDLDGRWEMRLEGETIIVLAPEIEFNAPAIDASAIRYEVREGSIFRSEREVLDQLRMSLTEMSRQRARDHIPVVLELGRRKTQEFIQKWLAHEFVDGKAHRVEVRFRDEPPRSPPREGAESIR